MGRRFITDFKRTIRAGKKRTEEQVVQLVQDHGWALHEELFARTPKKSGLLRGSWRTSLNTPSKEVPKLGLRESKAEYMRKVSGMKVEDSIFLVNNQPYARRIEHGWGVKNPPTGFVRPSLMTYQKRLKKRK
jgi:hypothetical protein